MVDAVVSYTTEKLKEFVTEQVSIRTGVKDGVEWLKDELGYLLISVRAAEAHQDKEHIRLWTDSVKDVAIQADVILERFSAQQEEHAAAEQGGVLDRILAFCCRFICICNKEANLFDIGKEIVALKEKIDGIKSRRDEYRINDLIIATTNVQQRKRTLLRAASFEHEEDVIGFEDVVGTLLAQLGNGDPSLGLISIHGMGGLGKSTLASKLYHSTQLSNFKSRAWVCVSEDYDITLVLKKIINSITGQQLDSMNKMEEIELLRYLRTKLEGDHYLVVIDDIWDVEVWKKIKYAFPDKKNGSRVIITTRSKIVAGGVDDACFVHQLRFLSEEESWELFCMRAKPTSDLEILGKEMVGKCGGLPLAIVILSGLLLQTKTYTFWSDVKDHLWRKLKNNSLKIEEILNLSYDDLSSPMRKCFLYLARFPEDSAIEVFKLKLLWIAEEFISEVDEEDGVVMEDVAEDYVNELANRNMIQIELLSPEGQVLKCRVHDLVRALAIEKAREHKILGIFDSSKQHPNPIRLLQGQSRHAVYNRIGEYLKLLGPNTDVSMLRSLAITKGIVQPKVEEVKLMYTRFKYLKVLDLSSVKSLERIPEISAAPIPTFYKVYKKKSTEGFQSVPYVVGLFSCMLWIYYALLKSNTLLLITINSVGCVFQSTYICLFLFYAPNKARIQTLKLLVLMNVVGFGLIVILTQFLTKGALNRVAIVGWICLVFSLCVFVAPLCVVRQVIRTKSVEYMPFLLSFFLTLSAVMWFFYGLLLKDYNIAVPNVLGFTFGVVQMVLYMMYKNTKKVMVKDEKLPELVKGPEIIIIDDQQLPELKEKIIDVMIPSIGPIFVCYILEAVLKEKKLDTILSP